MAGRIVTSRLLVLAGSKRFYSTEGGKNVAFLGLGNMGNHMASNLVKKGFSVRGYDASPDTLKAASSYGVTAASSIRDCVRDAQWVVSILPNNDVVREVYLAKDGVVASVPKGTLLIDSSTVEPTVSQEVSKQAEANGVSFIDAPVSGGVMGAQNATLAFLVGGSAANVERAKPLLSAMGARTVHMGDIGAGEVAKLCNNLLMAINMLGTAECLNIGIRMGLDPKALVEVVNSSSGRSWCSDVYCPVPGIVPNTPSSVGYAGGFKNDLLVKDLTLVTSIYTSSKSPSPLGAVATQLYRLIQTKGHGEKDFSYIYQFLKE